MTKDILKVQRTLVAYMAASGMTQSEAAKQIGVSSSVISQFLADVYPGDNEAVSEKVAQFLELCDLQSNLSQDVPFCKEVSTTTDILLAARIAHATREIALVYGPAGCGKTTALKHYTERYHGVIYVEATATIGGTRNILLEVLEALGEPMKTTADTGKSAANAMRLILEKVQGTSRLLIIDEAQHLQQRAFDALRAINDKGGIGLVFAGNPSILQRMFGRMKMEYDQLYSRIGIFCELENNYTAEDITAIFGEQELDRNCMKHLLAVSHSKGGLRLAAKEYSRAVTNALALGAPVSFEILQCAHEQMSKAGRYT